MKRPLLFLASIALTAAAATAATFSCKYYTIDTPDDSWQVTQDHALGEMGARMMISRNDGTKGLTHLARVDYVDRPFTPESYLKSQVTLHRDNFTHSAINISEIADTTFAGYAAQRVKFNKEANGATYDFTAIAFNAGFGTFFIIQGQQDDAAAIVGRVTSSIKPAAPLQVATIEQMVDASKTSLQRRRAVWDDGGEKLMAVSLDNDGVVKLDLEVPFITLDAIDLPTFIQTKRKQWIKHRKDLALRCGIVAMAVKEGRSLRYVYHDSKGQEIGQMLILPEEVK